MAFCVCPPHRIVIRQFYSSLSGESQFFDISAKRKALVLSENLKLVCPGLTVEQLGNDEGRDRWNVLRLYKASLRYLEMVRQNGGRCQYLVEKLKSLNRFGNLLFSGGPYVLCFGQFDLL